MIATFMKAMMPIAMRTTLRNFLRIRKKSFTDCRKENGIVILDLMNRTPEVHTPPYRINMHQAFNFKAETM